MSLPPAAGTAVTGEPQGSQRGCHPVWTDGLGSGGQASARPSSYLCCPQGCAVLSGALNSPRTQDLPCPAPVALCALVHVWPPARQSCPDLSVGGGPYVLQLGAAVWADSPGHILRCSRCLQLGLSRGFAQTLAGSKPSANVCQC